MYLENNSTEFFLLIIFVSKDSVRLSNKQHKPMLKNLNRICLVFFSLVITVSALKAQQEKPLINDEQILKNEIKGGFIRPSIISGTNINSNKKYNEAKVSENKNNYTISTKGFSVLITKSPFSIELKNNAENKKWALKEIITEDENAPLPIKKVIAINRKGNEWELISDLPNVKIFIETVSEKIIKFSLRNNKNKPGTLKLNFNGKGDFYGGGERFMGSKLNGRKFTNQPTDHFWIPWSPKNVESLKYFEPSYLSVPFLLTPQGNGLYVDQANTVEIDLLNTDKGLFSININNNNTDVYFFMCESPIQILTAFTSIVGRTPLMPAWANGTWINLLEGKENVYQKIKELKKLNIPFDAVWIFDLDDPTTNTGWTYWTKGYYGKPRELTDSIHKMGYKALTYLRNYIDKDLFYYKFPNPIFDYCNKNNLILKSEEVTDSAEQTSFHVNGQLNFYNNEAKSFWENILKKLLVDDNFDGWMEDFGDINHYFKKKELKYIPLSFKTNLGMTNDEIANLYPLVYHKASYEISHKYKNDIISLSRSGSAGSGKYSPIIWGGDQYPNWDENFGYVSAISAGISAGLSGYSVWAPDILSNTSRELWMRWIEFGAMSPVMRDHLWENAPNTYKIWTDSSTMMHFKKYSILHKKFIPYLNACAKEAHETGVPIIRHTMLEYPSDTTTYDLGYQYLLGDKILVAPVLKAEDTTQKVYLPEGKWKYYWSKKVYKGKNWVTVQAPVDEIPFFIKQGSYSNLLKELE